MTGHRLAAVFFIGEKMKKIIMSLLLMMASSYCAAIPTAPSVTFGTTNPNPPNADTFNKYDGSVYVKTSDGTANGTVDSIWHYSVKNNKWVQVPAGSWGSISGLLSRQIDLQTALNGKQATLSLTTTGNGAATLSGATINVPTPSIPAQFNPTAGAGVSISGAYPNMTFTNTSLNTDAQTLTNDGLNTMTISGGNSTPIINSVTATTANQFLTVRVNGQQSSSLSLPYFQRLPLVSNASSTSTTRTPITGWQFDVTAGKNYRVEIIGTYQTAVLTTGGSLGFVLTSGSGTIHGNMEGKITSINNSADMRQSIYAINNSAATAGSFLTTTGVGTINKPHYIGGSFIFNCTGSGTVQAQWGSEVAASAAQLNAGSVMFLTEF